MESRAQKWTHAYTINQFMTKESRIYNGIRIVSSLNEVGKPGKATCKRMNVDPSNTIEENQLMLDYELKYKTSNHRTPKRKHRE